MTQGVQGYVNDLTMGCTYLDTASLKSLPLLVRFYFCQQPQFGEFSQHFLDGSAFDDHCGWT